MYAVEHQGTWYRCRLDTLIKDQVSIFLVDLGLSLVVSDVQLHPLDHRFQEEPFLAVRCSMWGLRPAGHVDRWSRTSHEKMMEVFKMASKCFIQIYSNTSFFQSISSLLEIYLLLFFVFFLYFIIYFLFIYLYYVKT